MAVIIPKERLIVARKSKTINDLNKFKINTEACPRRLKTFAKVENINDALNKFIEKKHVFKRSYIIHLTVFYLLITIGAICVSKSNMVNHEPFEFVFGIFIAGTGLLYVYFGVEKSIKILGCISIISGCLFIFNYF